jgi:hypothetical protein
VEHITRDKEGVPIFNFKHSKVVNDWMDMQSNSKVHIRNTQTHDHDIFLAISIDVLSQQMLLVEYHIILKHRLVISLFSLPCFF